MGDAGLHATPLRVRFPAAPTELAWVRARLRDWLAEVVPDPDRAYDLLLAAGEACINSIEHGHRGDREFIRLEAVCEAGMVRITVADSGHWVPRAGADSVRGRADSLRGRGLALMRALVAETRVTVIDSGTVVELASPVTG